MTKRSCKFTKKIIHIDDMITHNFAKYLLQTRLRLWDIRILLFLYLTNEVEFGQDIFQDCVSSYHLHVWFFGEFRWFFLPWFTWVFTKLWFSLDTLSIYKCGTNSSLGASVGRLTFGPSLNAFYHDTTIDLLKTGTLNLVWLRMVRLHQHIQVISLNTEAGKIKKDGAQTEQIMLSCFFNLNRRPGTEMGHSLIERRQSLDRWFSRNK